MAGINRADPFRRSAAFAEALRKSQRTKPCIFLSHISIDKRTAIEIGDYIMNRGDFDIYLDIYDDDLQQAVLAGDPHKTTALIENGLENSTHIMCLVSNDTVRSWWVPYELGFAKRAAREISTLTLKDTTDLPDYLKIGAILKGTKSLNTYLESIASKSRVSLLLESTYPSLISHSGAHPLDNRLNWNA